MARVVEGRATIEHYPRCSHSSAAAHGSECLGRGRGGEGQRLDELHSGRNGSAAPLIVLSRDSDARFRKLVDGHRVSISCVYKQGGREGGKGEGSGI